MVTPLIGRPSTKRSHISSGGIVGAVAQEPAARSRPAPSVPDALGHRLFHQPQRLALFTQAARLGLGRPDSTTPRPAKPSAFRVGLRQPIRRSRSFFRAIRRVRTGDPLFGPFPATPTAVRLSAPSRGSLARRQALPKRPQPANSSVHRLVVCRSPADSGAVGPAAAQPQPHQMPLQSDAARGAGVKAANPVRLKALIAFRAVSVSQFNSDPICDARLPMALPSNIWQRRSTKASCERKPVNKAISSSSLTVRTNSAALAMPTILQYRGLQLH